MRLLSCVAAFGLLACVGRANAADFPKGTFTVKHEDIAWAVTFDGKGKFSVTREGKDAIKGTVKIKKDEIEFTDEEGDIAGKDENQKYTYKWKLDGKKLTFTKVKDENSARENIITSSALGEEGRLMPKLKSPFAAVEKALKEFALRFPRGRGTSLGPHCHQSEQEDVPRPWRHRRAKDCHRQAAVVGPHGLADALRLANGLRHGQERLGHLRVRPDGYGAQSIVCASGSRRVTGPRA